MVGWKVQPYGGVSTLGTTYVHEPPEAMLRESKTPFVVVPWGTRALLRQKTRGQATCRVLPRSQRASANSLVDAVLVPMPN